jgi:hypothetical protein
MRHQTLFLMACIAAAGCTETNTKTGDFGAAEVARLIVAAQAKCAVAGSPNLLDCAGLPPPNAGRNAAETADFAYEAFVIGCHDTIGRLQCDSIMELAYAQAKRDQTTVLPQVMAPSPAQSPAP